MSVGTWGSEDGWGRPVRPGWFAGAEEHAEPVVLEVLEPAPAALDVLHEEVQAFGRPVRCAGGVVGEDLELIARDELVDDIDVDDLWNPALDGIENDTNLQHHWRMTNLHPTTWFDHFRPTR